MTTYVLVHGAWHGGWCWQPVRRALAKSGLDVLTPTLTGLGERAHLGTPAVGLETHVADICAVLECERLTDVVLVGHSYAGMVVTNVAARLPERISRLVIVDGFLPEAGDVAIEMLPSAAATHYRDSAQVSDGWTIPPRPLANLGVTDEAVIADLSGRLTPHPLKTYLDASPHGVSDLRVPGSHLLCTGWITPFRSSAERAADHGWLVEELNADHEVPVTNPLLLADHLMFPHPATASPSRQSSDA